MAFAVTATAIVPKGFKVDNVRREIAKVLIDEGKRDRAEFNKTVEAWTRAPAMVYETKITGQVAQVWIGPKGSAEMVQRWIWLDEGTEPHTIAARNAPTLRFPFQGKGKSYNPKTRPLWLGSVSGAGQKFGPVITPKAVGHTGNEPRYWSKTLAAQRIGPFAANIQAAVNRGMA